MTYTKYFLTAIVCTIALNLAAQNTHNDSLAPQKLPVQAFAAMPVLLGVGIENAFPHDKKYRTSAQNELSLPMQNSQMYSLYGALPIVKKTKGFSAKINFGFNVFQLNAETSTLNILVICMPKLGRLCDPFLAALSRKVQRNSPLSIFP